MSLDTGMVNNFTPKLQSKAIFSKYKFPCPSEETLKKIVASTSDHQELTSTQKGVKVSCLFPNTRKYDAYSSSNCRKIYNTLPSLYRLYLIKTRTPEASTVNRLRAFNFKGLILYKQDKSKRTPLLRISN